MQNAEIFMKLSRKHKRRSAAVVHKTLHREYARPWHLSNEFPLLNRAICSKNLMPQRRRASSRLLLA